MRRTMMSAFIILLGIICFTTISSAQTDKVDDFVQAALKQQRIPGLALAVMRDGKIVKAKGYGLANVELNVPVIPETIFQSGSTGKQFTAMAIMMLVEDGKLGLDDKISKYLPGAPETWKDITVRHLLTHTSGIHDYWDGGLPEPPPQEFDLRAEMTEDQMLQKIEAYPPDFAPGEKWRYSNSGYLLLGLVIHKASGKFYGDFLQERVFGPLGMKATRIISEADIIPNRSSGYRLVKGELKNQEWLAASLNTTADGALLYTVLDLEKWDAALYTEKLIKRTSLDQMWTPVKLNNGKTYPYGFGWDVREVNGHKCIEHGGSWQGFTTYISRYIDDKLTVVVLTNLDSEHSRPAEIVHGVAGLYVPALTPPPLPKPIEDKEPQVTSLFRDVLKEIGEGKADPAAFTDEARKQLFPDRIKSLQSNLEEFGLPKSVELLERKDDGGLRSYRYLLTFENGLVLFQVLKLTPEGKIAEFKSRKALRLWGPGEEED